jgi:hypothetical protein
MVFVPEGRHDSSQARSAWNHEESSDHKNLWTDNDFNRPSGTGPLCIATQALRTWLLSACPSGTKAVEVPQIILVL